MDKREVDGWMDGVDEWMENMHRNGPSPLFALLHEGLLAVAEFGHVSPVALHSALHPLVIGTHWMVAGI